MVTITASDVAIRPSGITSDLSPSRKCFPMAIIVLLGMVNSFGGSTVLIGPKIQDDLGFSTDELQWLSTSFYIPLGCFSLMSGKIADLYGGKRTCVVGMVFFVLPSLGACFASTKETLFLTRGISGLGSALATVAGYPIVVGIFVEGASRSLAQAIYVAAWPTGGVISLLAIGFLAEADWHRYFDLLTGLLAGTTLAIILFLPDIPGHRSPESSLGRDIDWVGGFLSIAGLVLVFYVLAMAPAAARGWGTPYIAVLLLVGLLLLFFFVGWQWLLERRTRITPLWITPLVPLGVFALDRGRVSFLFLVAILCFAGYSGYMFLMTLYLEVYLDLPLNKTSLHFIPGTIAGITCNIFVGLIANKVSARWILMTGATATGVSLILFATLKIEASFWTYTLWAMILSVLGAECAGSAGIIHVTREMKGSRAGLAGGLYGTFIQLGFSLGPSVATIGLRYIAEADANRRDPASSMIAYDDPAFRSSSYFYGLQRAAWILGGMTLFDM